MLESTEDNQFSKSSILTQPLILGVIALILMIVVSAIIVYSSQISDPYTKTVLSLEGDPVRGHAMFQINCSGCHGLEGNGNVGPSLINLSKHRSSVQIIHQVISGETPPMPKFHPKAQDMADLLSYLEEL